MTVMQRTYALTRIASGDYLLPSNDGQTLWRITSYWEDGSATWGDGTVLRGTFWQTAKRPMPNQSETYDGAFFDWSEWETWETSLRTRREAIEATLR